MLSEGVFLHLNKCVYVYVCVSVCVWGEGIMYFTMAVFYDSAI